MQVAYSRHLIRLCYKAEGREGKRLEMWVCMSMCARVCIGVYAYMNFMTFICIWISPASHEFTKEYAIG